jgi:hypothetical protein
MKLIFIIFFLLFSSIVLAKTDSENIADISKKTDKIIDIYSIISKPQLTIFGTDYQPNQNGTIWLQLLKNYEPINNASCFLTAYYPNKNIFLNNVLLNYLINSDGIYYYDLVTPNQNGVYMLSASCYLPCSSFSDDFLDYSKLGAWKNVTIQDGNVFLSNVSGELPNYNGIDNTANMTGNVLLYHLNELSGTIYDTSGSDNNGITSGVSYGLTGVFDKATKFLTTSYINAGKSSTLNLINAITVSFWFNTSTHVINAYPLYKAQIIFSTNPSNTMRFYLNLNGTGVAINTGTFAINEWHNVVGTYDKNGGTGNFRIYLDGILQQQLSYSQPITDNLNYNLYIGSNAGANGWSGIIDEVAIWNRSLSATEVSNLYNRTSVIKATSGYIQSIPLALNGSTWLNYSSSYLSNDGNVTFSILNSTNSTLCSDLGNITTCADSISPIKLYAKLSVPTNTSLSPYINSWSTTWSTLSIEQIKGSGEMNVQDITVSIPSSIIEQIALAVIKYMIALKNQLFSCGLI